MIGWVLQQQSQMSKIPTPALLRICMFEILFVLSVLF
jgi:hypothetical protein